MTYDPDRHHRRSIRLKDYDYTRPGAYFVTICTYRRECILGKIVNGEMRMNEYGEVVRRCWADLPGHYTNAMLDAFVIMPNHIHGIIVLTDVVGAGLQTCPYKSPSEAPIKSQKCHALPEIVRGFKTFSARRVNERRGGPGIRLWQRNYYEHIIRNEKEWLSIQEYIQHNPVKWEEDVDHPARITPDAL